MSITSTTDYLVSLVMFAVLIALIVAHAVRVLGKRITVCDQAQVALRESEERYRRLIETAAEGIWIIDAESKTSFVNNRMAEMLGYSVDEMLGKSLFEFMDAEGQAIATRNVERRRQGIKEQHDFKFQRQDGSAVWAIVSTNPIFDAAGQYTGALGMVTDITERKRNEQERIQLLAREQQARAAAEAVQQRFLSLVQGLDAIVTEVDPITWEFSFVSQRAEAILGYPTQRWLTEPNFWVNLVHPDDLEKAALFCRESTAQGQDHKFEYRAIAADGRIVWLRDFVRVLLDGEGHPRQLLGLMVDITDQKQIEQALQKVQAELETRVEERTKELKHVNEQLLTEIAERQQAEAELREISLALENAVEGISKLDVQGQYVAVNRAYATLTGYQLKEMIGISWQSTVYPEDVPKLIAAYQQMLAHGKVEVEARGVRKDGSIVYKHVVMIAVRNQQQQLTGHYCFAKDITERKQAELTLRQSEDRFRTLIRDLHVGVLLLNANAQIELSNPAARELLGLTESQLLGKTCFDPEWNVIHEDGSPFPGETLPVPQAIATGKSARDVVMGVYRPTKGDRVWLLVNAEPQLSADGSVKQVICSLSDITERKRTEEEIKQLNADLQLRALQLETANQELEAFSYSVSHDLRAPLRAINGFSRILLNEYAPELSLEVQRYLQMVRDNALQMSQLIDDLLTFSRLSRLPLKKQQVQPAEIVRQALANLHYEQENRKVEVLIRSLPPCQADLGLLKQVWINLLGNALKYTRQQQIARIEIGCQSTGSDRVYFVKDNGVGFEMQYAHKLFGVFQRLHRSEEYEGTGVGLAIVQRIIHRHGGQIWAEAAVNQGATFYFTLEGS